MTILEIIILVVFGTAVILGIVSLLGRGIYLDSGDLQSRFAAHRHHRMHFHMPHRGGHAGAA